MIPLFFFLFFSAQTSKSGNFFKIRASGTSFKIREIPGKSGRVGSYESIYSPPLLFLLKMSKKQNFHLLVDEEHWDLGSILAGEEMLLDHEPARLKPTHFDLPKHLEWTKAERSLTSICRNT